MKIIYTSSITKDVKKIKNQKLIEKITSLINELKTAPSIKNINGIKRLKGTSDAYRIRIGDYRLGFYLENNNIILVRILKRNDIYKVFP